MKKNIITKSFLIWLGIIPLAFINGGLREIVLIPNFGKIGLPISAIILCAMIFFMSYIFIPKLGKAPKNTFVKMGIYWAIATIIFEVLLGFIFGKSFREIFLVYNIFTGNLWTFVILLIAITPITIAKTKKLLK